MKRLTLIVLLFTSIPLSIFSQIEFKIITIRDSMYIAAFNYTDGEHNIISFITKDSSEVDSLKKGQCIFRVFEQEKKRKAKRENILKAIINSPIPDFEAPDTMGMVHHPSNYRGRVLILHFWNFWDFSFEKEIPYLNKMIEKYRKDGLEILSFMDIKIGDSERKKLNKEALDFTLIPNSWQFSDQFLNINKSKPYMVLVDKKGIIRHLFISHKWQWDNNKNVDVTADFEEKVTLLLKE